VGLLAAAVVAPTGAVHASTLVTSVAAAETRTFTDTKSDIKVEVTPGDSSTWRQGDVIKFHVSGMTKLSSLKALGTCPGDLPLVGQVPAGVKGATKNELDPSYVSVFCGKKLSTGIPGGADATGDTPSLSSTVVDAFAGPQGTMDVDFRVGMGRQLDEFGPTLFFHDYRQEPHDPVTCDAASACVVGFGFARGDGSYFSNLTDLKISPAPKAVFDTGSCTKLDPGQTLTASGPERLQTPLSALDRGFCGTKSSPVPVSFLASETGEAGPTGIATVGTSADLAFIGSPALTTTPLTAGQVAVPIAINAAALAQTGGISTRSINPDKFAYNAQPLPTIHLAPSDVARIVLHDYPTAPYDANVPQTAFNPLGDIIAKRPGNGGLAGFDPQYGGLPFTPVPTPTYGVGQNSVAVSLSDYLSTKAASDWVYPDNSFNQSLKRDGKAVGALTSFDPLVDRPAGETAPHLTSQMSSINSIFNVIALKDSPHYTPGATTCPLSQPPGPAEGNRWLKDGCVRFIVLDAASAASVGLTSVALGSGTSAADYVAPSVDGMQAAATAAAGKVGDKGYFAVTNSGAYPLTFVEYAVVSTNALVDDACAPRTAQRQMLKDFLGYATTTGQAALPAGLAGLTPELVTQATAAIARIGTTTVARCVKKTTVPPVKPPVTPTPPVTPPAPLPPLDNGTGGGGDTSGSGGDVLSGSTAGPTTNTAGQGVTAVNDALGSNARERKPVLLGSKQVALQDATFSGASRMSPVSSVVGLLVLLLLVGIGAAWASGALALPGLGRRVPPASPMASGGTR